MAVFNEFYYNTNVYGVKPAVAYSAEPVAATAINYTTVQVTWLPPTGTYTDFRIVRNQEALPQTQEDGAIIYSYAGIPPTNFFLDTPAITSAPLAYGKFAFYRAWVRVGSSSINAPTATADSWVPAGEAYTLVPSPHTLGLGTTAVYSGTVPRSANSPFAVGDVLISSDKTVNTSLSSTHDRFMSTLPRVFTTTTNSSLDVIQNNYDQFVEPTGRVDNSLISTFLSAFSFTLDEFLTFARLITSSSNVQWSSPTAITLGSHELGMPVDVEYVTTTQRKLLKNAIQIYQEKGTKAGLQLLLQSMTDFSVALTNSPNTTLSVYTGGTFDPTAEATNLLLSHEDATFDIINWAAGQPVGNWQSLSPNLTLAVSSQGVPVDTTTQPYTLDTIYCATVLPTIANQSIALGIKSPVTTGIPVTAGKIYSLSFYAKEGPDVEGGVDTDTLTMELRWFDRKGNQVIPSTPTVGTQYMTTGEGVWTRYSLSGQTAPAKAVYAGIVITFSANYMIYLDLVQFENGFPISPYQEPRSVNILFLPSKTNYIKNPSFEGGVSRWVNSYGTLASFTPVSPAVARSGLKCMSAVSNGAGLLAPTVQLADAVAVTAGTYYSGSIYVQDFNTTKQFQAVVKFYNGSTLVGTATGPATTVTTTTWTRVSVSAAAPATATLAQFSVASVGVPANTTYSLFDCAQFEASPVPTDYFDGDLIDDGGEWTGTSYASYSVNYPSKSSRLARVKKEIESYLGFDTPYYGSTYLTKFSGIS